MSWTHNTCFMTAAKYMRYWYHKKLSPYITDLYLFQSLIFLWSSNELLFYIGDALKLYCFLLLPWGWQFKLFHKMMFSWSEYALKYSINMTISSLNKCWWTLKSKIYFEIMTLVLFSGSLFMTMLDSFTSWYNVTSHP
jgi:hypothetical protein